jgi:hypothetical protein
MKSAVTVIFYLCVLLPVKSWAQCPEAGMDSSVTYCRHEVFDLSELLSPDASPGGVFLNPAGDTLSSPLDSLTFPGIYTYSYIVSDTACENDTAAFYVTIENCPTGGTNDLLNESHLLVYPNPAMDHLVLSDTDASVLLIYDELGKCVYRQTAPLSSVIFISDFDSGLYLLILRKDGYDTFQRFQKIDMP